MRSIAQLTTSGCCGLRTLHMRSFGNQSNESHWTSQFSSLALATKKDFKLIEWMYPPATRFVKCFQELLKRARTQTSFYVATYSPCYPHYGVNAVSRLSELLFSMSSPERFMRRNMHSIVFFREVILRDAEHPLYHILTSCHSPRPSRRNFTCAIAKKGRTECLRWQWTAHIN